MKIRKAENLIIGCEHDGSYIPVHEVLRLIRLTQIETIEETVKLCAQKARIKLEEVNPQFL